MQAVIVTDTALTLSHAWSILCISSFIHSFMVEADDMTDPTDAPTVTALTVPASVSFVNQWL